MPPPMPPQPLDPAQLAGWCQLLIFAAASALLGSIYRQKFLEGRQQDVVFWLAAACGAWSVMGLLQLSLPANDPVAFGFRDVLSGMNTACFLVVTAHLGMRGRPWIEALFGWLREHRFNGMVLALGTGLTMILVYAIFGELAFRLADALVGLPTAVLLMNGLKLSFKERAQRSLAGCVLGLVVLAQVFDLLLSKGVNAWLNSHLPLSLVTALYSTQWVVNLSYKCMLAFLFLILLISWIYTKSAIQESAPPEEWLRFSVRRKDALEDRFQVELKYNYPAQGIARFTSGKGQEERLFLRVLDLAIARKLKKDPQPTDKLYPMGSFPESRQPNLSTIRGDFGQIVAKCKVDPLFLNPRPATGREGGRQIRLESDLIFIEPQLAECEAVSEKEYWRHLLPDLKHVLATTQGNDSVREKSELESDSKSQSRS